MRTNALPSEKGHFGENQVDLISHAHIRSGTKVIKLFLWSTQLRITFILLINVKITFMSRINTCSSSENLKEREIFIFQHFSFRERLKFHAQLS